MVIVPPVFWLIKRVSKRFAATLMLLGLFFGAAAEFITMLIIRHKTRHVKFMVGLPIFIMLHIALAVAYIVYLRPLIAG